MADAQIERKTLGDAEDVKRALAGGVKEPTDVPGWVGIVGEGGAVVGLALVVIGFTNGSLYFAGVGAFIMFAGGYSWGLHDGWRRALKATP